MIKWNFPLNNDGKEDGLNDPGIETFRDDPIRALAREINQNSSDAADKEAQKPVEVHFDLFEIPIAKFPDVENFRKMLAACERYWRHNAATRKFFLKAKQMMSEKLLPILKISDYNTSGLLGSDGDHHADWFKLTKSVGASDKEGGAGGSFGIGKHAPFACSDIRCVLYGTKDKAGKVAFQGVARLVTHEVKGETTQGTGYYGVVPRNEPITKQSEIPHLFRRRATGTDIFVAGFSHHRREWANEIIRSVLENFFVAIHEGRLIVKVGETVLNQSTLPDQIRQVALADPDFRAGAYFSALTSEEAVLFSEEDFEGLGRIEMRVLVGKEYPRRIAMVRNTGMKIYDKGNFQTPIRFAGVLIAKGTRLNEVLRAMEPPSHNDWQPERYENPDYARALRRKLYAWINDRIRTLSTTGDVEELDAEGVSQYLPDDQDELASGGDDAAEGEKGEPLPDLDVQVRLADSRVRPAPDRGASGGGEEDTSEGTETGEHEGRDGGSGNGGGGRAGENGEDGGAPRPKGDRPAAGNRPVGLRNLRVYCSDAAVGCYRILFEPENSGTGHLDIKVVGEEREEPAPIKEVRTTNGGNSVGSDRGRVGPITFEKGKRASVEIVLRDSLRCALGVSAYAD